MKVDGVAEPVAVAVPARAEILSNVVDRGLIERRSFDPFCCRQFPEFHRCIVLLPIPVVEVEER